MLLPSRPDTVRKAIIAPRPNGNINNTRYYQKLPVFPQIFLLFFFADLLKKSLQDTEALSLQDALFDIGLVVKAAII